ncbi:MAG: fibronectin type III domain-containing protein, partial [Bacteroidales bacterium]|nr:fibronectin type III domain-containing protein [Bacteroidales bacterium]
MKKNLQFLCIILLTICMSGFAQESITITIGTGTNDSYSLPINNYYKNSWSEMIYPASDITERGYITSIGFDVSAVPTSSYLCSTMTIYMGVTSNEAHSSNTDWLPMDALTDVWSATDWPLPTTTGWLTFDLDNPFQYDGNGNLVIVISKTMPNYTNGLKFRYTEGTASCCLRRQNDNNVSYADHPSGNTGTLSNQLPNIQLTFSSTTDFCHTVSNLTVSSISTHAAAVSWSAPENTASYILQYKTIDEDWEDNDIATVYPTTNTYTLTDLTPNTRYIVRVAKICGNEYSSWRYSTFKTECDEFISVIEHPYYESFEDYATYSFPDCWTRIAGYSTSTYNYPYIGNASSSAHTGNGYLYAYNNASNPIIMALPLFKEDLNTLRLSFWMKAPGTNSNYGRVELGVMTDLADTSTFALLHSWSAEEIGSTNWAYYEMDLDTMINGGNGNLVFRRYVTGSSTYAWFFDDVTVMPIPACKTPTGLTALYAHPYSEDLIWDNMQGNYNVYYKKTTEPQYTSIQNIIVSDTVFSLGGLAPSTTYQAYVAAICEDGSEVPSSATVTFTTLCAPLATPYSENFNANSNFPDCWERFTGLASDAFNGITLTPATSSGGWTMSNTHMFGEYHPRVYVYGNSYGNSCRNWLVSPVIDLNGLDNPALRFDLALTQTNNTDPIADSTAQSDDRFLVIISTDDGASWSADNVIEWNNSGTGDYVYNLISNTSEEVVIPLTQYSGQIIRIAFYGESTVSNNANYLHIDNVMVGEDLPCLRPIQLMVSNITTHSAELSWVENGNATSWTVEYGPIGFIPGNGKVITVNDNPNTIIRELLPSTDYEFYVAANCGEMVSYQKSAKFRTADCSFLVLPYTEDFESYTASTVASTGVEPVCGWELVQEDAPMSSATRPQLYYKNIFAHSGNYSLKLQNRGIYAMPTVAYMNMLKHVKLEMYLRQPKSCYALEVGVWEDDSTFVPVATFNNTTTEMEFVECDFSNYTGKGHRIAFRNVLSGNVNYAYSYNYIDDITLTEIPITPTAMPYYTDFSANSDQNWRLKNGICANYWTMGTPNDTIPSALFITQDGNTAGYNLNSFSTVMAEKTFFMPSTEYVHLEFDVMVGGERNNLDFLKVFLTSPDEIFNAGTTSNTQSNPSYITNALDFSDYRSIPQGSHESPYVLNVTNGNILHISTYMTNPEPNGMGKIVFLWTNDQTQGTQPGAIITNFSIQAGCEIFTLPYTEDFESYTESTTAATGVEPICWELVQEDASMTDATRPQLYYKSNYAHSGNYSLRLQNRGIYAMQELSKDIDMRHVQLEMYLRQPKSVYRLQVGVLNADGEFEMVEEINNATTETEFVTVSFYNYMGTGRRIAFRNVLQGNLNYAYSYNYLDDIVLKDIAMIPVSIPYFTDFSENSDKIWRLNNSSCPNYWMMGSPNDYTLGALFVTQDGSSAGYEITGSSTVMAEKAFLMPSTNYIHTEFDVLVGGEGNSTYSYDYLKVFLTPIDETFVAGKDQNTQSGSTYSSNALNFSDYKPLTNGCANHPYVLNLTKGNTIHVSATLPNIAPNGTGKIVFLWRNDLSIGNQPGAVITNFYVEETTVLLPTVITKSIYDITDARASCNGEVIDNGGAIVTERGVCWSTNPNPTIEDAHTASGSGNGLFGCVMTNLTRGATYYVRAYATNGAGTGYGEELIFSACTPISQLPYTEDFESYTESTTAATGVDPICWELVQEDVTMTDATRPQLYYKNAFAHSGDYSLMLRNRGIYAMPTMSYNIAMKHVKLDMYLRQPNAAYRLQVGVWDDETSTFTPVATFNNSTTEVEHVECDFSNYTGNGHRIAFRNVLGNGVNLDYSNNYIDDITLTETDGCPLTFEMHSTAVNGWGNCKIRIYTDGSVKEVGLASYEGTETVMVHDGPLALEWPSNCYIPCSFTVTGPCVYYQTENRPEESVFYNTQINCNSNGTPATPAFSYWTEEICNGVLVHFVNESTDAEFANWDFGDGTWSGEYSPVHKYTSDGTYPVTLFAYNSTCGNSLDVTNNVTVTMPAPTTIPIPYFEDFDFFTESTNDATGIEPTCWELVQEDVTMTEENRPQIHYGSYAYENYSLLLNNRGIYAMPPLEENIAMKYVHLGMFLCQPNTAYQLEVGVWDDQTETFELIATFNNSTTEMEYVVCDFSSYTGNGRRIAFHNVLGDGGDYDYSYNYIDNIDLTESEGCATLTFEMHDSYGDGWNGNSIRVYSSGFINEVTMYDGYKETTTITVHNGPIELEWATGDWPEECSFSVIGPSCLYYSGGAPSEGVFLSTVIDCDNNDPITIPAFTYWTENTCNGVMVHFENESTNAESVVWDFGDGTGSEEFAPDHEYTAEGIYIVSLTVNNSICEHDYFTSDNVEVTMPEPLIITLPFSEDFESYTTITTPGTGVEPCSWVLVHEDVQMPDTKKPQLYYKSEFAHSGNYSLVMNYRGIYAMPPLEENMAMNHVHMEMYLRQPNAAYQLEVGVWDDELGTFEPVATFNNSTTGVEHVKCNFFNYTGNGRRIAFHNVLGSGNYSYSYNYIDDIVMTEIDVCAPPAFSYWTENTCNSVIVHFENNSSYAESTIWDFGDGTTSEDDSPTHEYPSDGYYFVTLSVNNSECENVNTTSYDVEVPVFQPITTTFDTIITADALPITWHGQTFTETASYTSVISSANGCDSNIIISVRVIPAGDALPCPGHETVTDYDGNVYNTVQIGEQCWMRENLRTTHYEDGTDISTEFVSSSDVAYCYLIDNNENYVESFGHLYNWAAIMHGDHSSSSNPSDVQGICPTGWHLPSDAEWTQLTQYVSSVPAYVCGGNESNVAKALASETGWYGGSDGECVPSDQSVNVNNLTGFNALPAGILYEGEYSGLRFIGLYWSSTEQGLVNARFFSDVHSEVLSYSCSSSFGMSVRCVLGDVTNLSVTTGNVTVIAPNTAICGGNVTTFGDATATARGVCWSTSPDPSIADNYTNEGSGLGEFTSILSGLEPGTTYYIRAYATNDIGTRYGGWGVFRTPWCEPITLPYSEGFDSYTASTTASTSIEPACWMLVQEDVAMTDATRPQIYYKSEFAHSGDYSLKLHNRGIYAMPPLDENMAMKHVQLEMYLRQPKADYQLEVGVWDDETHTFEAVQLFNNSTTNVEHVTCDFSNYTGNGRRIAFHNVLGSGSYAYSYNYIDDIVLTETDGCLLTIENNSTSYGAWHGSKLRIYTDGSVKEVTFENEGGTETVTIHNGSLELEFVNGYYTFSDVNEYLSNRCFFTITGPSCLYYSGKAPMEGVFLSTEIDCNSGTISYPIICYDTIAYTVDFPLTWHGHQFDEAGSFTTAQQNASGCDSTTIVSVNAIRSCPGTLFVTDIDGNIYSTVKIGNQCWMRENLRTTHYADGSPIPVGDSLVSGTDPYYYDYSTSSIPLEKRGYLYNWPAALQVCPVGWRLPSDEEWNTLERSCGMEADAESQTEWRGDHGRQLAGNNYWSRYSAAITPGNVSTTNRNESGFSAVPAGLNIWFWHTISSEGSYYYNYGLTSISEVSYYWSSTEEDISRAWYRALSHRRTGVRRNHEQKECGFSVRCIRDEMVCSSITLPYTETFESYTASTTAETGVQPRCWEVTHEDVALTNATKPQVYYNATYATSGSYTLRMKNRCVYALPELNVDQSVNELTMTFKLRQPKAVYRLQVGVVDAQGNFTSVKTIN